MKKSVLIGLICIMHQLVPAQNEQYIPTARIKTEGPYAAGVEVRNVPIDSKVLDALFTLLSNSSEVSDVSKTSAYVKYSTAYFDDIYFVLAQGSLPARIVTLSRLNADKIGVIRRLDNNMLQSARFLSKCIPGQEDKIFNIFAGYEAKFYYTQTAGTYSRVYIDQSVCVSGGISPVYNASGYLIIPPKASSFCFRMSGYNSLESRHYSQITSLKIQDNVLVPRFVYSQEPDGFGSGFIYAEDKAPGTYKYSIDFTNKQPGARYKFWFESLGMDSIEPIAADINGNPQRMLRSKSISELIIPD